MAACDVIIITNNSKVLYMYEEYFETLYIETDYMSIVTYARDTIHKGHRLLTHPLAGSLKPNQTPYKSFVMQSGDGKIHFDSLSLIEKCIESAEKFLQYKSTPQWNERILNDFRTVDLSLIEGVINNHNELPKRRYVS